MHQSTMKRVRIIAGTIALGVAVTLPVSADAPSSGVERQYAEFDKRDSEITDRWTHLTWDRPTDEYPAAVSFAAAKASCPPGMRLPSLRELLTIVDEDPHEKYDEVQRRNVVRYIDRNAFNSTPADDFWTSSLNVAGDEAWTVNFGTGTTRTSRLSGDTNRVRCVAYTPP